MKNQKVWLTFVLCLIRSFALADSPTDAPLLPNDANAIIAQRAESDVKQQKRRDKNGKCEKMCAAKNMAQCASEPASAPSPDKGNLRLQTDSSASF